ncbi:MAG: low molecular weight phosphatase family protein [Planctomycetota bacterium]
MTVPRLLFVCVHNAGRSQMAAAFARHLGGANVEVISAGSAPGPAIHPGVAAALAEVGIDVGGVKPRRLERADVEGATVVVTMGCGDACPVVPGVPREDWPLLDPAGKPLEQVRPIREDIRARVEDLLRRLGVPYGVG